MKTLFYLWGIFPLIVEFYKAKNPKKYVTWLYKKHETERDKRFEMGIGLFNMCYFAWMITGLFSAQYFMFGIMILSALLPKKRWLIFAIDAYLSILIILFIILNQYHFHIDVASYVFYKWSL